jgi:hypothetical protein
MAQLAREVILGQTSACTDPAGFTRIQSCRNLSRGSRLNLAADVHNIEASPPTLTRATDGEGLSQPLLNSNQEVDEFSRRVRLGINASWVVNVVLLVTKTAAFVLSGSYAVLASAVDSLVDLLIGHCNGPIPYRTDLRLLSYMHFRHCAMATTPRHCTSNTSSRNHSHISSVRRPPGALLLHGHPGQNARIGGAFKSQRRTVHRLRHPAANLT